MITEITTSVLGVAIGSGIVWLILSRKNKSLQSKIEKLEHDLKSGYVKFGKSFEHFVPFIKNFPSDREKTIFLGMPIDFISFEEDSIKFIEVKTGQSQLNPKQKKIKNLIENKKIEFIELRY